MAGVFCGNKLADGWFGNLESRSGDYKRFYYPRQLPADDDFGNGWNILAIVYYFLIGIKSSKMDYRDNGVSADEGLGTRVGDEWTSDTGIVGNLGNLYI